MSGRDRGRWWWREGDPRPPPVTPEEIVGVRVNHHHLRVPTRAFLRIFRNGQGDWCAEIVDGDRSKILVFDYHPTVTVLNLLKKQGANIAEDVVVQGAEGMDVRGQGGSR